MTTCPRCNLPREPASFIGAKGPSKWCDLCREAFNRRLRSLGMAKEPTAKAKAAERTPLDALLDLARLSGAAKHRAIELVQVHHISKEDLRVRKAWGNHYGLEAKLVKARRKYEQVQAGGAFILQARAAERMAMEDATSEGLGPIIEVEGTNDGN